MVKKKADEQKGHDECVREIADELKRDKWDVKANVEAAKSIIEDLRREGKWDAG